MKYLNADFSLPRYSVFMEFKIAYLIVIVVAVAVIILSDKALYTGGKEDCNDF